MLFHTAPHPRMWLFFCSLFHNNKGEEVSSLFLSLAMSLFIIMSLILLKSIIIPAVLFFLLPISDFRSTLFELFILIIGVLACFVFLRIGYLARNHYKINVRSIIFILHLWFLPLIITRVFGPIDWLRLWTDLYMDLIAEPYRLLTFTYQNSHVVGYLLPFVFMSLGYVIHGFDKAKEVQLRQQLTMKA